MTIEEAQTGSGAPETLMSVTELARELGVTPRTVRFYETKGLIAPARIGGNRVYGRRDLVRMKLILRGKRLGFSLRHIKEFMSLYDADPAQQAQMQSLIEAIHERRAELEEQRTALTQTLAELDVLEQQARETLERGRERRRP